MPDLDQIIVKVTADVAQFKAQMASADASLDQFGASAKAAGAAGAGVGTTAGGAATQFERYAAALKNSYGLNDGLTKSQVSVIRNLEAQVAATKLSGAELAAYTALRKAGTTADTEAGKIIAGLATAQFNLANGIEATTKPAGLFASIMGNLFPSLNSNTSAAKELSAAHVGLAAEHGRSNEAAKAFRETMHTVDPALKQAGASIGALGGYASAARGGIVFLGAALAGGLAVGLAEAGDKSEVLRRRLDALYGGRAGGAFFGAQSAAAAFKGIEEVSQKTGVAIDTVAAAYEKLAQVHGPTFVGGDPATALTKIIDLLKQGGASGKALADGISAATDVMAKGLDLAAFEKIRDISPTLGNAIAAAFGQPNVAAFEASLAAMPKDATQVAMALSRIRDTGPGIETTAQAFEGLWTSVSKLWEKLGESSQVKGPVISFLDDLKAKLDEAAKSTNPLAEALDKLGIKKEATDALDLGNKVMQGADYLNKQFNDLQDPNRKSFIGSGIDYLDKTGLFGPPTATATGLDKMAAAADKVATAADAAAPGMDAVANSAKNAGDQSSALAKSFDAVVGAISAAIAALGAAEAAASAGASGASGGGAGGSGGGGDIQAPVADVGPNAGGGIYKIGGAGAPDSIALSGMVTPGETVAVIPPDRTTPALLSVLKHAIGTSPIDAAPLDSKVLANVAAAVNGGAFGATPQQQQQALAKAVLLEQAKLAAGSSLLGGGQVLGSQLASRGGGARLGGIKQGAPSPWKDLNAPTYGAQPKDPTSGYGTGYAGSGGIYPKGSIYPSSGIYPTGRGGGAASPAAGYIYTAPGAFGAAPYSDYASRVDAGLAPGVGTGGYNFLDAQAPYGGNYADPVDAGLAPGVGTGGYNFLDAQAPYDPYSGDPYGGNIPGDPYGTGGSDGTQNQGSPLNYGDGGFDDSSFVVADAGGDGEYYGAYAKGGSFKVPGSGGTDSKRGVMDLTPGERVTVTPAAQAADQRPINMQVYLTSPQLNNPSSRRQLERMARNMVGGP